MQEPRNWTLTFAITSYSVFVKVCPKLLITDRFQHQSSGICTAPEMIPTPKWSPNRPRNDTDPEMIPIFLHVDPEMIPN